MHRAVILSYSVKNENFELVVKPELLEEYRKKKIVEIDHVLVFHDVYSDLKRNILSTREKLETAFPNKSIDAIYSEILQKGTEKGQHPDYWYNRIGTFKLLSKTLFGGYYMYSNIKSIQRALEYDLNFRQMVIDLLGNLFGEQQKKGKEKLLVELQNSFNKKITGLICVFVFTNPGLRIKDIKEKSAKEEYLIPLLKELWKEEKDETKNPGLDKMLEFYDSRINGAINHLNERGLIFGTWQGVNTNEKSPGSVPPLYYPDYRLYLLLNNGYDPINPKMQYDLDRHMSGRKDAVLLILEKDGKILLGKNRYDIPIPYLQNTEVLPYLFVEKSSDTQDGTESVTDEARNEIASLLHVQNVVSKETYMYLPPIFSGGNPLLVIDCRKWGVDIVNFTDNYSNYHLIENFQPRTYSNWLESLLDENVKTSTLARKFHYGSLAALANIAITEEKIPEEKHKEVRNKLKTFLNDITVDYFKLLIRSNPNRSLFGSSSKGKEDFRI